MTSLNDSHYDVVLMDCPWPYYGSKTKWGAAAKYYECMSFDDLANYPPPLKRPGVVFMWTTSAFLVQSIDLLRTWNLYYRGVAFVWVKTGADGKPWGARGVRPSITKPLTEFVIAGSTTAIGRPLPLSSESVCQTVFAPVGEHSVKPDAVQERIEQMYPNATKLEMYARRIRPGWDAWGNEV